MSRSARRGQTRPENRPRRFGPSHPLGPEARALRPPRPPRPPWPPGNPWAGQTRPSSTRLSGSTTPRVAGRVVGVAVLPGPVTGQRLGPSTGPSVNPRRCAIIGMHCDVNPISTHDIRMRYQLRSIPVGHSCQRRVLRLCI